MTGPSETAAIRSSGLGVQFGGAWALRGCSFSVPQGAVTALIGPNGAGKSTLLSAAAGLTVPTEGQLSVLASEIRGQMHPRAAFVSQQRPLPAGLRVREVVRMAQSLNGDGWAGGEFTERLLDGRVDLAAKTGTLSEGARSLVSIALALARKPDVLLLDEPLSALDPLARDEVLRALMAEVAARGMTVLMSSHVPGEVRDVCDHVLLLGGGRIELAGDIDDLLAEHRLLIGPAGTDPGAGDATVIHRSETARQTSLLVRGPVGKLAGWDVQAPDLDAMVLGYLRAN
jgi:ABC-2 type transport system ATP-binding protein